RSRAGGPISAPTRTAWPEPGSPRPWSGPSPRRCPPRCMRRWSSRCRTERRGTMANGEDALRLLGLARKAGRLEIGEEPVAAAARAGKARLILAAADAADNTLRRAYHFTQEGNAPLMEVPWTKGELGLAA